MNYGTISAYLRVTTKHFEATLTYLSWYDIRINQLGQCSRVS